MKLTRHLSPEGPRWAIDGKYLSGGINLGILLAAPADKLPDFLSAYNTGLPALHEQLAPVDLHSEIWASGVTYQRSREARQAESTASDLYSRVYHAERPELFFKAQGWRATGTGAPMHIRHDSAWNVPEPELVLILNCLGQIVAYTAGNDLSSRSIEAENPLYLPQAKIFKGSCALGPDLVLATVDELQQISISLEILRNGQAIFQGLTNTRQMKRNLTELAEFLFEELDFPQGALLFTGTGIVPPDEFTLQSMDRIIIQVGEQRLENWVE